MGWLGWAMSLIGLLWIGTSFGVGDRDAVARQLRRRGSDPRAAGPAIWVQRGMGLILVVLGALVGLHRR